MDGTMVACHEHPMAVAWIEIELLFLNMVQEECAMTCPACLSLKRFEASCDLFTKTSSISNGV